MSETDPRNATATAAELAPSSVPTTLASSSAAADASGTDGVLEVGKVLAVEYEHGGWEAPLAAAGNTDGVAGAGTAEEIGASELAEDGAASAGEDGAASAGEGHEMDSGGIESDVAAVGMPAFASAEGTQADTVAQSEAQHTVDKGKGREVESDDAQGIAAVQELAASLASSSLTPARPASAADTSTGPPPPRLPLRPVDTHAPATNETQHEPAPEPEEEWLLKTISWPPLPPPPSNADGALASGPTIQIVCQNANGPCSLLALCNILILRGDILIHPPGRVSVSYSLLSSLVADYLLRIQTSPPLPTSDVSSRQSFPPPNLDLASTLSILPSTRYGLNLNPRFGSPDGFRASASATSPPSSPVSISREQQHDPEPTGELALFALSRIALLHGWVVDPQDEETWDAVVEGCGDYDKAMVRLVEAEIIAGGGGGGAGAGAGGEEDEEEMLRAVERRSKWTTQEEKTVRDAHIIRQFLDSTQTQLTYHGLYLLSSQLVPGSLSALFRNSHLSVLYHRPASPTGPVSPALFTLVTDSSFATEPEIVWESLEDVDGSASEFFDGQLRRSSARGGDWVRRERRAESPVSRREERERDVRNDRAVGDDAAGDHDLALAQQLQQEEDDFARQQRESRSQRRREQEAPHPAAVTAPVVRDGRGDGNTGRDRRGNGRERERERERPRRDGEREEKSGKDKCVVM